MQLSISPQPNGAELAYLGDAVLELLVRRRLLASGTRTAAKLNRAALSFVKATAQSEALARIEGMLTEEELDFYRRGRNANGISIPKSASAVEYRRATGFEALFGALYLAGCEERIAALFEAAFPMEGAAAQDKDKHLVTDNTATNKTEDPQE